MDLILISCWRARAGDSWRLVLTTIQVVSGASATGSHHRTPSPLVSSRTDPAGLSLIWASSCAILAPWLEGL